MRLLRGTDRLWVICSGVAAALLVASAWLPLWHMELHAPQYPRGLSLTAYGTRIEGDVQEVNTVNHYVGVEAVHADSIPELALFPYLMGGLVAVVLGGAVVARSRITRAVVGLAVWAFALGFLVDLQWWLYRYGHERSADAPYRIDDFTPRVLGGSQVVNFYSETMVGTGYWLIVLAALLVTVGPVVIRFIHESWQNTGEPSERSRAETRQTTG